MILANRKNRSIPLRGSESGTICAGKSRPSQLARIGPPKPACFRINGVVRVKGLGDSNSNQVIIGKDGWLYQSGLTTNEHAPLIEDIGPEEAAVWRDYFRTNRDTLAHLGIRYLVVIGPDKSTVYPEHMPESGRNLISDVSTNRIIDGLKRDGVADVDPRAILRANKGEGLYYHTGVHWNDRGAFLAYSQVANQLRKDFPRLTPLSASDMNYSVHVVGGAGLAGMLGIRDAVHEAAPLICERHPSWYFDGSPCLLHDDTIQFRDLVVTRSTRQEIPKCMIFRDSFSTGLLPYLSEHISQAIYKWPYQLDYTAIEQQHPNIVIGSMDFSVGTSRAFPRRTRWRYGSFQTFESHAPRL